VVSNWLLTAEARVILVGFVMDEMALVQVFLQVLQFDFISIFPLRFHIPGGQTNDPLAAAVSLGCNLTPLQQ
jgi:hypothetical protein